MSSKVSVGIKQTPCSLSGSFLVPWHSNIVIRIRLLAQDKYNKINDLA